MNVLLIEDDPIAVKLVRELLRDNDDIILTHASSLPAAIAMLDCNRYDAALVDLNLPPESYGEETFFRLHGLFPSLPIVVLSGFLDPGVIDRLIRGGATLCVTKLDFASYRAVRTQLVVALRRSKVNMQAANCQRLLEETISLLEVPA